MIKNMVMKYSHAWPYGKMKTFSPDEYASSLANLPLELVQFSFEKAKLTSEFFPTISKLREIAMGIVRNSSPDVFPPTAEEAWYDTMKRLQRSEPLNEMHPLAYEVAVRIGVRTLKNMNESEESFFRAHYIKMYSDFLEREKDRKLDQELVSFMPKEKQVAFHGMLKNLVCRNAMITNPR